MTLEINKEKDHHIKLLKEYNFNAFPIPKYPKAYKYQEQKRADYRYDA